MFNKKPWNGLAVAAMLLGAYSANALEYNYDGVVNFCTATCDSFAALGAEQGGGQNRENSVVVGSITLEPDVNGMFQIEAGDNVPFAFSISTTTVPLEAPVIGPSADCPPPNAPGQICNATSVNPLPLDNSVATVEGSGQISPTGVLLSGTLRFVFTVVPFSNNNAVVEFDLSDGSAEGTLFGGVVVFLRTAGLFVTASDEDDDGVLDSLDNCLDVPNPDQRDSNSDGFGNVCDADINNDCVVNVTDLGLLRAVFFQADADADFNGDGVVNVVDLGILRGRFFGQPGPSGTTPVCENLLGPFGRDMFVRGAFTDDEEDQFDLSSPLSYLGEGQYEAIVTIDRTPTPPIEFSIEFRISDAASSDGHDCGASGETAINLDTQTPMVCTGDGTGEPPSDMTLNLLAQPQPGQYRFAVNASGFPATPPTVRVTRAP